MLHFGAAAAAEPRNSASISERTLDPIVLEFNTNNFTAGSCDECAALYKTDYLCNGVVCGGANQCMHGLCYGLAGGQLTKPAAEIPCTFDNDLIQSSCFHAMTLASNYNVFSTPSPPIRSPSLGMFCKHHSASGIPHFRFPQQVAEMIIENAGRGPIEANAKTIHLSWVYTVNSVAACVMRRRKISSSVSMALITTLMDA